MTNGMYALLSHSWSGLVIAAIVALVGLLIVSIARWIGHRWVRFIGYAVYAFAVLLTIGSVIAIVRINAAMRRYPRMGKLVDVGGYRMNILAEGDAHGGPTLVWIGGGHSSGLSMYPFHKVMRNETRSIIFDRPGTGWSDTGPFPRTFGREAVELHTLLDNAGERGPFILIGHSYGGLLAANYARRYPKKTAAVVLLDATPPDVFMYLLRITSAGQDHFHFPPGLLKLFGIWSNPDRQGARKKAPVGRVERAYAKELADVQGQLAAFSANPASDWADASLSRGWSDPESIWHLVVYDGELGNLPVYVVTPGDNDPKEVQAQLGVKTEDLPRVLSFLQHSRMRYLQASTKSQWIEAPAGTDHNYPYEAPDFVLEVVRQVLAASRQH